MATWIGASDAQRFWQYILPAAKRALAEGDFELMREHVLNEVKKTEAQYLRDDSSLRDKRRERRLEALRDQWRGIAQSEQIARNTVAEGERRKSLRRAPRRGKIASG